MWVTLNSASAAATAARSVSLFGISWLNALLYTEHSIPDYRMLGTAEHVREELPSCLFGSFGLPLLARALRAGAGR